MTINQDNAKKISRLSRIKNSSILVVGIVRDVQSTLMLDIKRLDEALAEFSKVSYFLVESDSTDLSVNVLSLLKSEKVNFNYESLGNLESKISVRSERLAFARNRYLLEIRKLKYSKTRFVIVADFNNLNNLLNRHSIESCWETDLDWAVCTANQDGPYYDIWALRHELWSPNDCWEELKYFKELGMNPELALYKSLHSRMIRIPSNSSWIEVDSAFGGFAIYRYEYLLGNKYKGIINNKPICEHVPLHEEIRRRKGKIYINPGMINTSYTDHSEHTKMSERLKRVSKNVILLILRKKTK